jgi:hypothetical protein
MVHRIKKEKWNYFVKVNNVSMEVAKDLETAKKLSKKYKGEKIKITKSLRTGGYQMGTFTMKEAEKEIPKLLKFDWIKYAGIFDAKKTWGSKKEGRYIIAYSSKPFLSNPIKLFKG